MDGWVGGWESRVKDCLQQSKSRVWVENYELNILLDGWKDGWKEGRKEGKARLRIAYSNQKKLI